MSQQPEVIVWPGGEHEFLLSAIGELKALEQSRDSGALEIFFRLAKGEHRIDDTIEVLRLGLIGGGMERELARKTVRDSFNVAGPEALRTVATQVLSNTLWWDQRGDAPGESKAGEATTTSQTRPSQTEEPDGHNITQPAL